jgi:hypothetical protein
VIQEATAVAYLLVAGYPATLASPAKGQRMTIAIDGGRGRSSTAWPTSATR